MSEQDEAYVEPLRVCFVCSGNICRSPMAEAVLRSMVEQHGLADLVEVDSAGTGDWHIGERADHRTVAVLADHGYEGDLHRARQFDPAWFDERDVVVALDRGHLRTLRSWARDETAQAKVHLMRAFDPALAADAPPVELDVPDPYYAGRQMFEVVLHQVESACAGLLDELRRRLGERIGD